MSDNNDFNSSMFKSNGQWTHQGSVNAGQWQSTMGQPCSGQQSNESWNSYQTRVDAYQNSKK
ncbi:MAG: hypothetical protein E6713_06180 [Sporomusaceae bacterium]|nr:hypothetical protein [Sporomusaceae bacterium]